MVPIEISNAVYNLVFNTETPLYIRCDAITNQA